MNLNYGKETETIECLKKQLEQSGKDGSSLDNSIFDFAEFSFSCHMKGGVDGSSIAKSLIISIDLQDSDLARPISNGQDQERPSGTLTLALELGNSRRDKIMQQLITGEQTLKSVSKIGGIEINELLGSISHQNCGNLGISQASNVLITDDQHDHDIIDDDAAGGISLLGVNWEELPEVDQPVVVPDETDEFWLKFDDVKNAARIVNRGIICESLDDFVKQSSLCLNKCANQSRRKLSLLLKRLEKGYSRENLTPSSTMIAPTLTKVDKLSWCLP